MPQLSAYDDTYSRYYKLYETYEDPRCGQIWNASANQFVSIIEQAGEDVKQSFAKRNATRAERKEEEERERAKEQELQNTINMFDF